MNPDNPQPDRELTIAELQREAHRLIDQLAYRPGAAKLLLGTLVQLRMFANYKSDRRGQMQRRLIVEGISDRLGRGHNRLNT